MKILLVEDDARTADFILKGLQQSGYTTVHAADGRDGLFKATTESCDLAVVDIMLPGLDGFTLIEKLRAAGIKLPVIVLSARSSVDDKIRALQTGGDDYLVKPFSFSELIARIQALLRRASATGGAFHIDGRRFVDRSFVAQGVPAVPPGSISSRWSSRFWNTSRGMRGRVVSKTMIMEHVWEYNFDPQTNIVETRMCRLREKLDKPVQRKTAPYGAGVWLCP